MNWSDFYKNRVNSLSYSLYFEKKYNPLFQIIEKENCKIHEMGCGIGSISKIMSYNNLVDLITGGFDNDKKMVELANKNVNCDLFYEQNIFDHEVKDNMLYVSHGVLEHFENIDLMVIREYYRYSLHYVPLIGYKTPSFGDERLLPAEFWLDLFKPKTYIIKENDLYFICK